MIGIDVKKGLVIFENRLECGGTKVLGFLCTTDQCKSFA